MTVAALGALVAAFLTVFIAFLTVRREQKMRVRNELNMLIAELHWRRVLHDIPDPHTVVGARDLDDFKHANLSVLDIRDQAKRVGREIRPKSKAQGPLSRMVRACNQYLEKGMHSPGEYHFHLKELRKAIDACVQELAATDSSVTSLEPGKSAF